MPSSFIHFHFLSSTFINVHPLSSTFINVHAHSSTFFHFHQLPSTLINFHPLLQTLVLIHPLSYSPIVFPPLSSFFLLYHPLSSHITNKSVFTVSTSVADHGRYVCTCLFIQMVNHIMGGGKNMACLSGKGHGKNKCLELPKIRVNLMKIAGDHNKCL